MAEKIKGITIEFRGNATPLQKAIREVNSDLNKTTRELTQVNKALKFNPTSVELWRQKQELLTKKVAETEQKLGALKAAQKQMDAGGVDKNSEEYRKLQREITETESKLKTFKAQLRSIGNVNIRAAAEQFKIYGDNLTQAGQAMRGISMAAAAVAASIGAITVKAGKSADELNTLSKVTGINTTQLQKYSYAADLVDVSVESIAKANKKVTKSAYDAANGSNSMVAAYDALGVSVTDNNGALRDSESIFQDVITALGQMTNETERDALAQKLLGKSAAELNPLIEDGGETYKMLSDTLAKYNLNFIDEGTLKRANEFNDSLDTIKAIGSVAFAQIGSQLASTFAPVLEKVVDLVGRFAEWLGNLDPKVLAIVGTIAAVVAAVAPVLLILGKVAFAISSIMSLMSTLAPIIAAISGPIGIAIAVIGAIIAAFVLWKKYGDEIKAFLLNLWENVKIVFAGIKDSIVGKIESVKAFLAAAWEGVKVVAGIYWNLIKTTILGPVGIVVNLLRKNWDTIKANLTAAFNAIKSIAAAAWNGIKNAMTKPITTAIDIIRNLINKVKGFFPIKVGNLLSGLKLPHFKLNGKFSLNPPSVPKLSVDWYAKGGIFNSPTIAGIGEIPGGEAVVPLDKFWSKLDRIAENASGETNIVININGANASPREIAEEVKRALIQETNRRRLSWQ